MIVKYQFLHRLKLMTNTMKYFKHLLFLSILCSLVLFTNCGEEEGAIVDAPADNTDDGSIDSISITPSALSLAPGESGTLTANILPSNATDTTFAWTSSNETIATIDQLGIVTAITAGETTITAVSNEGGIEAVVSVIVPISISDVVFYIGVLLLIYSQQK